MMDYGEILRLLRDEPDEALRERAEDAVLASKGRHIFVRGLIEFSNRCRRNCRYCGLRAQNYGVKRYLLSQEEILRAAQNAAAAGADTIVLQSGEGGCQPEWLAEVVRELCGLGLPITLSVGEWDKKIYEMWRKAGAARYLLRHETSDADLYAALHPGYSLENRLACLKNLRDLDYEVGSGFMAGLPGQSLESIAKDILTCARLDVDMAGIGPFIPQKGTPLAGAPKGAAPLALRAMAALRISHPRVNQPATTALATLDPRRGQTDGLRWGANVLMASFTPKEEAGNYSIYDNKHRVEIREAAASIEAAGRTHALITEEAQ